MRFTLEIIVVGWKTRTNDYPTDQEECVQDILKKEEKTYLDKSTDYLFKLEKKREEYPQIKVIYDLQDLLEDDEEISQE